MKNKFLSLITVSLIAVLAFYEAAFSFEEPIKIHEPENFQLVRLKP
jgi:hypothetical protein